MTSAFILPDAPALVQLAPVFHPERPILRLPMFKARVKKLLEAQLPGTALALRYGFLTLDAEVGLVMYGPSCCGESPDEAMDIDESCWDDEIGAWEGEMHADTWRYLSAPVFDYTHVVMA